MCSSPYEHIGNTSYFILPSDIGFTLFTPIKGRIYSLTVYIYKAETCTNILRYNTCMSARITKYLNKYVRRVLCLIYISSFYFWNPPLATKIRKNNVLYYPEYSSRSWHPILYIYKAETCTNILRYNTCMSSYPGDRKWNKIEP
jgi:hypothetical protein